MASINGVEVKKLKAFKDHEGETIYQGDVYLNGTKLGFWSQDAWCGDDTYRFDVKLLDEAVKLHKESPFVEDKYKDLVTNPDFLMHDIIRLSLAEKDYKKGVKQGYDTFVCFTYGGYSCGCYVNADGRSNERIEKDLKTTAFYKKLEPQFLKKGAITTTVYRSLDDFIVDTSKTQNKDKDDVQEEREETRE